MFHISTRSYTYLDTRESHIFYKTYIMYSVIEKHIHWLHTGRVNYRMILYIKTHRYKHIGTTKTSQYCYNVDNLVS